MPLIRTVDGLVPLGSRAKRLLAVFPHPDDEAYGAAGALARTAREDDAATVLLCLTRGEAARAGPENGLTPEELGRLREGRLERVAEIVGLDGLLVPGLPDSGLAALPFADLARPVRDALAAFRPQVVITHDARGVNAHPDHIATHWAVRRALEDVPGARLAMVAYLQETCDAVAPRLLFPTAEAEIDVTLELDPAETDAKEACLRVHEALVTLKDGSDPALLRRPPIERYDLLHEHFAPPLRDLFEAL